MCSFRESASTLERAPTAATSVKADPPHDPDLIKDGKGGRGYTDLRRYRLPTTGYLLPWSFWVAIWAAWESLSWSLISA